ncbi:MAG: 4Fe-4S binding protein [Planctomycetota bacterium]
MKQFECPGITFDSKAKRADIDRIWCIDCGYCLNVCPTGSIVEMK